MDRDDLKAVVEAAIDRILLDSRQSNGAIVSNTPAGFIRRVVLDVLGIQTGSEVQQVLIKMAAAHRKAMGEAMRVNK